MIVSPKRTDGYNIFEVLLALSFVGLVTVMMMSGVIYSSNDNTALFKAKNICSQIKTAAFRYKQTEPPLATLTAPVSGIVVAPGGVEIMNRMNYVTKVNDNSITVDGEPCGFARTCYKFADGGVLQMDQLQGNGVGVPFDDDSYFQFNYDPDGEGAAAPINLILFYTTGRVTTLGAMNNNPALDPGYVYSWTKQS